MSTPIAPDAATAVAVTRLAASALLAYPDTKLQERTAELRRVLTEAHPAAQESLERFIDYVDETPLLDLQKHYVQVFDLKRKASPLLTFWTDGDTRNRGYAMVRFTQAYRDAGYAFDNPEMPDHLAVVLEFAATCDRVTGEALLADHAGEIGLLADALAGLESPYADVVAGVVTTLPEVTEEVAVRMAELARSGPPTELVGLAPFEQTIPVEALGGRR